MKFLVITKANSPIPPEMLVGLFDALSGWAKRNVAEGKLEQVWGFAGLPGGGGIANVSSLEALDTLMTTFPLGPFSSIELLPLVELEPSLEGARQAFRAMMPPGQR